VAVVKPMIAFRHVSKTFDRDGTQTEAIGDVSFEVTAGEFVCVLGPSGCGKSTLLNLLAGLDSPTSGEVEFLGRRIDRLNLAVGYMSQTDTLLPWRTVIGNILLPLEIKGVRADERRSLGQRYLKLVGLETFSSHFPSQLSGGMRRRLMLARTLVTDPQTILMDEPFGALDAQLKLVMQEELLKLWTAARSTIVFVTHDIAEAITLGTRVVLLSASPSRVKLDIAIDLPFPRDVSTTRMSPLFAEYHEAVWSELRKDYRRGVSI
jgi:NitT/TauT family transport system ATP-binding protein